MGLMWVALLLVAAGCEGLDEPAGCPDPPGVDHVARDAGSTTCVDVRWGCARDAMECIARRGGNSTLGFVRHKGREIGCSWNFDFGVPDCDAAWDEIEAWCAAYPECQF